METRPGARSPVHALPERRVATGAIDGSDIARRNRNHALSDPCDQRRRCDHHRRGTGCLSAGTSYQPVVRLWATCAAGDALPAVVAGLVGLRGLAALVTGNG